MKTIVRVGYASFSVGAATVGLVLVGNPACSTTEVNDAGGAGSSSSGGGSSGASSSSGSGGNGSSGAGSSSSSGSGSGGEAGASACNGVPTVTCSALWPPPAGGAPLPFPSNATTTTTDAGTTVNFGGYPTGGGSYSYPGSAPLPDQLADSGCANFASQSTVLGSFDPATTTWTLAGKVGTFSGVGFYTFRCLDLRGYTGLRFTVAGTLGDGSDAGPTSAITLRVSELPDDPVSDAGGLGACTLGSACGRPSFTVPVTSAAQTVTVHWTDLMNGSPCGAVDNPGEISGIEFALPYGCGQAPYTANLTISNLQLVQN